MTGRPAKGRGTPRRPGPAKSAPARSASAKSGRATPGRATPGRGSGGKPAAAKGRGGRPTAARGNANPTGRRSGGRAGTPTPERRRSAPRDLGGEQVEGRQAVRELLLAGRRRVREVLVAERRATDEGRDDVAEAALANDDIAELARDLRVPVRAVSRGRLASMARSEAPQGVLALADALEPVDLDQLASVDANGRVPFLVAVDGVTDPGNLGALLRAAECAGATGVVLPRHRAVHITPTVAKAAAGAVEHLPMALVGGLPAALGELSKLGVWSVGLDATADQRVWDLSIAADPVVLVLGAEGAGLSRLVRQRCDQLASIPQVGNLASLNVATAAAVACFEVARHRLAGSGDAGGD